MSKKGSSRSASGAQRARRNERRVPQQSRSQKKAVQSAKAQAAAQAEEETKFTFNWRVAVVDVLITGAILALYLFHLIGWAGLLVGLFGTSLVWSRPGHRIRTKVVLSGFVLVLVLIIQLIINVVH